MDREKAYRALGLDSLDDFLLRASQKNAEKHALTHGPQDPADPAGFMYRQIGASTWMCVEIAMTLAQGTDALLIADTRTEMLRLSKVVTDYLYCLTDMECTEGKTPFDTLRFGKTTLHLAAGSDVAGRVGFSGKRFCDSEWKAKAIRRIQGPFEMIRRIERTGTRPTFHYKAYDEDGEFIMELTSESAQQLLDDNEYLRYFVDGVQMPPNRAGPVPSKWGVLPEDSLKTLTVDEARQMRGEEPLEKDPGVGVALTPAQLDTLRTAVQKQHKNSEVISDDLIGTLTMGEYAEDCGCKREISEGFEDENK